MPTCGSPPPVLAKAGDSRQIRLDYLGYGGVRQTMYADGVHKGSSREALALWLTTNSTNEKLLKPLSEHLTGQFPLPFQHTAQVCVGHTHKICVRHRSV